MLASRFEVLPFGTVAAEAALLARPTALTVTCSPRHEPEQSLAFAARLHELGHVVTAHLAARAVRDAEHADALLRTLARAGIGDVFVIGGDQPQPAGAFASAGELLELLAQHPQRPQSIGIAAYPEGHPLIDEQALWAALARKSELADYITTQMCFDADRLLRWLHSVRDRGMGLPVLLGLPGIVDRRRLLDVSLRIGVGPSLRYIRKQRGAGALLVRRAPAERLLAGLAPSLREPGLGVSGIHYFTFNQLLKTWSWDDRQRRNGRYLSGP